MSQVLRRYAVAMVAAFSAVAGWAAPSALADPVATDQSAAAVIDDLTDQGYDVQINWVSGVSSVPLSLCRVLGVHNPSDETGPPTTFTTVYVDVSCPNHEDQFGFNGGIGLGFG